MINRDRVGLPAWGFLQIHWCRSWNPTVYAQPAPSPCLKCDGLVKATIGSTRITSNKAEWIILLTLTVCCPTPSGFFLSSLWYGIALSSHPCHCLLRTNFTPAILVVGSLKWLGISWCFWRVVGSRHDGYDQFIATPSLTRLHFHGTGIYLRQSLFLI